MAMSIDKFYTEKFNTTKDEIFQFLEKVKAAENHWFLPNGMVCHDPQMLLWEISVETFNEKFLEKFDRMPKKPVEPGVENSELEQIQCQKVESKLIQYIDKKPVFEIIEPVLIDNKFIYFFDKTNDAYFKIRVKQVKGAGAGYADDLTKLNNEHIEIITVWLNHDRGCTLESIRFEVNRVRKLKDPNAKTMKPGSIQGRLSELFRRGIITKYKEGSKWYMLQTNIAKEALKTGEFPEVKTA